jgi:hypothetical protein
MKIITRDYKHLDVVYHNILNELPRSVQEQLSKITLLEVHSVTELPLFFSLPYLFSLHTVSCYISSGGDAQPLSSIACSSGDPTLSYEARLLNLHYKKTTDGYFSVCV